MINRVHNIIDRISLYSVSVTVCILLAIAVSLSGCTPRGVISTREMRSILYDLHRTDGVLNVARMELGYDEALARYYQSVLDKHGVTQAQFDSSLVWYTDHPAYFDKLYPKVMKQLDQDIAQWELALEREQTRRALLREPWTAGMPYDFQVVLLYMQDSVPVRPGPMNRPTNEEWLLRMRPKFPEK